MEVKAGFKKTEVGLIPKDWDYQPFSHLYKDPSRNGIYKASEYQGRGTRIVNMKEMFGFNFISDQDMSRIVLTTLELSVGGLQDGDLLFGRRSVVPSGAGKCSLVITPTEPITFESSIIRIRLDKKKACPRYYYYFFSSSAGRTLVGTIISGTNIKGIRASELRELKVPRPPSSEQQTIAVALSHIDALIESLEQLITKKRNIKQGAMQELLTGKTRLQGFSGKWEVKSLGEIGNFKNGLNKDSSAFGHGSPFVNLMDVFGVNSIHSFNHLGLVASTKLDQNIYDLKRGDVIFIRSSVKPSGVGLTVVIERDLFETVYSGFLIRLRDNGFIDIGFKKYCFYEESFRKKVIAASSVSANTNINQNSLRLLTLILPPTKEEQTAIAAILSDMDTEITALETKLEKARRMKQGMMHELLTGRIRLV